MAMNMSRAFNARMLSPIVIHTFAPETFDDDNNVIEGVRTQSAAFGVVKSGNKFSQFEEGQAIHNEDGGIRVSDFRSLYITDNYTVVIDDKIEFKGMYFNVLQRSPEDVFGFNSFILERSKNWVPV